MTPRLEALRAIHEERKAQDRQWGEQNHGNTRWLPILTEEVGEVAKAINEGDDPEHLIEELIQVAAVAVSWVEAIGRREQEDYTVCFHAGACVKFGPGGTPPPAGDAIAGYPVIPAAAIPDAMDEGHLVLADG